MPSPWSQPCQALPDEAPHLTGHFAVAPAAADAPDPVAAIAVAAAAAAGVQTGASAPPVVFLAAYYSEPAAAFPSASNTASLLISTC